MILPTTNTVVAALVGAYFIATAGIGYWTRKHSRTSVQFLHARRALPAFVTAIAFLAANCGALEIVGIVAASAKYGVLALHFYWIGAIPGMVLCALFMMPIYVHSGAMTVPEYLHLRYNRSTHILSAFSLAIMMMFISGISLYATGYVLHLFFGWSFFKVISVAVAFVLCYALLGGVQATIYNELMQFGLTVAGLAPMAYIVFRDFHGAAGIAGTLPSNLAHLWTSLPVMSPGTGAMDVFGIVFGLGFVLSCSYWCTDFVLIQRALASRTIEGSINTPLIAAIAKLFFPWLVIFPGMLAMRFLGQAPSVRYDQALPLLMQHYYGPALLGLGIAAILASLMSGLAGNISAFSSLWTHDLYRLHLRPGQSDAHYLWIGRLSTIAAACLSVGTAYIALRYNNLMDYLQLIFSVFNAPLFATFVLGFLTKWATPSGGFWGLLFGMIVATFHNLAVHTGLLFYGSQMLANYYGAIYGWTACAIMTLVVSAFTEAKREEDLGGLTYATRVDSQYRLSRISWILAGTALALCVILNILFR